MTDSETDDATAIVETLADLTRGSELTLTLASGEALRVEVDRPMHENSRTESYVTVFPKGVSDADARTTHYIYCYGAFTEDDDGETIVAEGEYRTVNLKQSDSPYPTYIEDIDSITVHSRGGSTVEDGVDHTETTPERIRELIATLQTGDKVLFSTEGHSRVEYLRVTRVSERYNFAMLAGPRGGTYSVDDMAPRPPMLQSGGTPIPLSSLTLVEAYADAIDDRVATISSPDGSTTAYSGRVIKWADADTSAERPYLQYEWDSERDTVLSASHTDERGDIHISGPVTTEDGESALVLNAPSDATDDIKRMNHDTVGYRPGFETFDGWLINVDSAAYVIDFLTGDIHNFRVTISADSTFQHPSPAPATSGEAPIRM